MGGTHPGLGNFLLRDLGLRHQRMFLNALGHIDDTLARGHIGAEPGRSPAGKAAGHRHYQQIGSLHSFSVLQSKANVLCQFHTRKHLVLMLRLQHLDFLLQGGPNRDLMPVLV